MNQNQNEEDWWSKSNWTAMGKTVMNFQERISIASKLGNKQETDKLMELLAKSEFAKMLAIYLITQKSRGRFTPGIDGKTYLTPKDRINLSEENFDYNKYQFQPVLIKQVPKFKKTDKLENFSKIEFQKSSLSKTRSLGIMTIKDRVMTKIVSFALTAKWEPLLESNVMGYRYGRSRQDAINRIYYELKNGEKIVLEADIKNCFEDIKHDVILEKIDLFKGFISKLLTIKVSKNGSVYKKKKGIIQGNPLSPILANIALHGMQELIEIENKSGKLNKSDKTINLRDKITLIRYADDFVVIAPNHQILEKRVIPNIKQFFKKKRIILEFREDKNSF